MFSSSYHKRVQTDLTVFSVPHFDLFLPQVDETEVAPSDEQEAAETEGFGKLYPSAQTTEQQEERSDDECDLASGVVSRKELEKGRLSRDGKYNLYGRLSG